MTEDRGDKGIFTHDDGDDRQWTLSNALVFMSTRVNPGIELPDARDLALSRTPLGDICGVDLRKTARGASSPAKPALHIPEL